MSGDMTDAEKADAFRQAVDDSWRVKALQPYNRWRALFDRFEIDPHGPDATARMVARLAVELGLRGRRKALAELTDDLADAPLTHVAARLAVELSMVAPKAFPEFAFRLPTAKRLMRDLAKLERKWAIAVELESGVTVEQAAEKVYRSHRKSWWLKTIKNGPSLATTFYQQKPPRYIPSFALDPVERATDELLALLAIGRWPPE